MESLLAYSHRTLPQVAYRRVGRKASDSFRGTNVTDNWSSKTSNEIPAYKSDIRVRGQHLQKNIRS